MRYDLGPGGPPEGRAARSGHAAPDRHLHRRCGHEGCQVDAGPARRRRISGRRSPSGGLDPPERAYVRPLVETQALFPDDALPLGRRIVAGAQAEFGPVGPDVLNGVVRTVAQAVGLADLVAIGTVAVLSAPAGVVFARVAQRRAGE